MTMDEADRHQIWNDWLDGDSVNRMHRYLGHTRRQIETVLSEDPPAAIRDDHRYVHACRTFWISAEWPEPNPASGERDAFVVVRQPRTVKGDVFVKAVRAIRRDFRQTVPGGDLKIAIIEGVEGDVADKFVRRGFLGWSFDESGNISRFAVPASPEPDPGEEAPSPRP